MKNKLKKRNQTKFDHTMKKFGVMSLVLSVLSVTFIIPLANKYEEENSVINQNIELIARKELESKSSHKYFEFNSK
jgi:GTP cyclohydrolase II